MWTSRQAQIIPGLLGPTSEATDINSLGEITGWMGTAGIFGASHGFLWQAGRVIDIGISPGASSTHPTAINNNQQIVGDNWYLQKEPKLDLTKRAFSWSAGNFTELPLLDGYQNCLALDVSDAGLIVGHCDGEGLTIKAVLWHNGVVYDLYELIPNEKNIDSLWTAWAINNEGVIAVRGLVGEVSHTQAVLIVLTPIYPAIGDLNCDEVVNAIDLANLLSQWGPGDNLSADCNADGAVDAFDLANLLANWGPAKKGGD